MATQAEQLKTIKPQEASVQLLGLSEILVLDAVHLQAANRLALLANTLDPQPEPHAEEGRRVTIHGILSQARTWPEWPDNPGIIATLVTNELGLVGVMSDMFPLMVQLAPTDISESDSLAQQDGRVV